MRILKFKVSGQTIQKDPECNFDNIVSGTEGYLVAEFSFSSEWNGCKNIARFFRSGKEYALIVDKNNQCKIPSQVLKGATFTLSCIGSKKDYQITTNKIVIRQEVS